MWYVTINPCVSDGAGVPSDVQVARELLSAANETFKMAQHIVKLECELNKLKKKIKARTQCVIF